jgi:hypothetical protein
MEIRNLHALNCIPFCSIVLAVNAQHLTALTPGTLGQGVSTSCYVIRSSHTQTHFRTGCKNVIDVDRDSKYFSKNVTINWLVDVARHFFSV